VDDVVKHKWPARTHNLHPDASKLLRAVVPTRIDLTRDMPSEWATLASKAASYLKPEMHADAVQEALLALAGLPTGAKPAKQDRAAFQAVQNFRRREDRNAGFAQTRSANHRRALRRVPFWRVDANGVEVCATDVVAAPGPIGKLHGFVTLDLRRADPLDVLIAEETQKEFINALPEDREYSTREQTELLRRYYQRTAQARRVRVGPRPAGQEARHLNRINSDNKLSNPLWGTTLQNSQDTQRHGTMARGERHGKSKLTAGCIERARDLQAAFSRTLRHGSTSRWRQSATH
jgi:hypothetical protein